MTQKVKAGDFIELDYTGKTKDDNTIFDTTQESVAKEAHLHTQLTFKPIIVCVGEQHLLPGLDKRVDGLELGDHTIDIPAEEAFGKKSAKLLQLIPRKVFKEQKVQPMPGLEINVDGQVGIIKTVSGGRIIVDFNHPLASKDLVYDISIKRVVTDQLEQVKALLALLRLPVKEVKKTDKGITAFTVNEFPEQLVEGINKSIEKLTGTKVLFEKSLNNEKPVKKEA